MGKQYIRSALAIDLESLLRGYLTKHPSPAITPKHQTKLMDEAKSLKVTAGEHQLNNNEAEPQDENRNDTSTPPT